MVRTKMPIWLMFENRREQKRVVRHAVDRPEHVEAIVLATVGAALGGRPRRAGLVVVALVDRCHSPRTPARDAGPVTGREASRR